MARPWDERRVVRTPDGTQAKHVFNLTDWEIRMLALGIQDMRKTMVLPKDGVDALTQGRYQTLVDLASMLLGAKVTVTRVEER